MGRHIEYFAAWNGRLVEFEYDPYARYLVTDPALCEYLFQLIPEETARSLPLVWAKGQLKNSGVIPPRKSNFTGEAHGLESVVKRQ